MKRHIQAISSCSAVTALSYSVENGDRFFKKHVEVFVDENGVTTHQVTIETKFRKLVYMALPLHYLVLRNYIRKNLVSTGFDVLHSHVIFPCAIVGHFLAVKFRVPHVITEHWTKIHRFFKTSAYAGLGRLAYNKARAVSCVSKQLKDALLLHVKPARIEIIPNVIDSSRFYHDPAVVKHPVLSFIAVANWAQFKNPFLFLNALQELFVEKRIGKFQVIMVGNGEKLDKVRSKGYSFDIIYRGTLSEEELFSEYNKCHVFVHGSEYETFSVVIAEALMCGLPCVVSPVGIAPDVISDRNGFIADNSIADWKSKLHEVTRRQYDQRLIAASVREKYSLSLIGKQFAELY